jgi:hypothetical protein
MQITQNDAGLPTVSTKYPVPWYRPVVTSMAGKAMSGPPVESAVAINRQRRPPLHEVVK